MSPSVQDSQFQRKSGYVLVYTDPEHGFFFLKRQLVTNKTIKKYEELVIMGDFKVDINSSGSDKN